MVDARVAGHTLEQIGSWYDLTRERVRQITMQAAPWHPWDATRTEARALTAEHDRVRLSAAVQRAVEHGTCRCCGQPISPHRQGRRHCSKRCRKIAAALRRHTDPDVYRRHWRAVRRWHAEHDGTDGPDGPSRTRSAFTTGSTTWAHAIVAVRDGWPIADLLSPDAAQQLWRWIDDHPGQDPDGHRAEPDLAMLDDREWLHDQYVASGRSSGDIADQVGCSAQTVLRALNRHGIPVRSRPTYPLLDDFGWLAARALEGHTDAAIGELAGGASPMTVWSARTRFGIHAGRTVARRRGREAQPPDGSDT